jgi:hypothetical protein
MKDLKSAAAIWIKGALFFLIAISSSVLLALTRQTFPALRWVQNHGSTRTR